MFECMLKMMMAGGMESSCAHKSRIGINSIYITIMTCTVLFSVSFHVYSGTCLLQSPLGRNILAVIDRWLL